MTENEELKKAALQLKAMLICTSIKTHRSCSGCVNENDCGKEEYDTDKVFAKSANIIFDTLDEFESYQSIGTIEEFKALKEADVKGANRAVDEFANYLHKIAKENNGLRLSSETKSWTHPCIFDYLEEFKNLQTCKEET